MSGGGETPSHNHWRYQLRTGYYLAGRLSEGENNETMADVWGISSGQNTPILVFNARGIASSTDNLETYKAAIESAIENTFGIEISEVSININRYQIGEPIEDWDTYEEVN